MTVATRTRFPYVPWDQFLDRMDWEQGEHVTIIAPTGDGKTTLMTQLIPEHEYVMYLQAKARDDTLDKYLEDFKQQPKPTGEWPKRVLVKPPFYKRNPEKTIRTQRAVFREALLTAFSQEGWAVFCDESRWLTNDLDLKDIIVMMLLQGRSLGISMVFAVQRPRHVPLEFYDQPTHLFLFPDSDRNNLDRLDDLGGNINRQAIKKAVSRLEQYHFLYVNTRTNEVIESKVEL